MSDILDDASNNHTGRDICHLIPIALHDNFVFFFNPYTDCFIDSSGIQLKSSRTSQRTSFHIPIVPIVILASLISNYRGFSSIFFGSSHSVSGKTPVERF